ncbi:MAG: MFS transporter [Acidobacteria bacterium]|nr:MFS transporter [Acidobacteriota bacterium]MCW5967600.1 MFS transporter [Blastocatellales bacterium]
MNNPNSISGDDSEPGARIYYGWVIVAVCFLVMTLIAPIQSSFSVFYVAILDDLKWSRADTALALSSWYLAGGIVSPFAGGLVDRYGPRLVMPIGAVVTAGAFIWTSRMTQPWHFYVAFGLLGAIGSQMLNLVPLTTVISNWFARHRGLAIGLISGGLGLGQVGIPAIQYLIEQVGWRNAYIVLGILIMIIPSTLILLFLHRQPADKGLTIDDERGIWRAGRGTVNDGDNSSGDHRTEVVVVDVEWAQTDWTIRRAVRKSRFWLLISAMVLDTVALTTITVQLVAYLTDIGYSAALAASAVGLEGVGNIVGRFVGGAMSDRVGREKTLTLGAIVIVCCVMLLSVIGGLGVPALVYVFALCFGFGHGLTLPAFFSTAADLFQGRHFGSILGVCILGGYSGGALGAWLSGYMFDVTQAYSVNFTVSVVAMTAVAALIWRVRPGRIRYVRSISANVV